MRRPRCQETRAPVGGFARRGRASWVGSSSAQQANSPRSPRPREDREQQTRRRTEDGGRARAIKPEPTRPLDHNVSCADEAPSCRVQNVQPAWSSLLCGAVRRDVLSSPGLFRQRRGRLGAFLSLIVLD